MRPSMVYVQASIMSLVLAFGLSGIVRAESAPDFPAAWAKLNSDKPDERAAAVADLDKLNPKTDAVMAPLFLALQSKDEKVKATAEESLARIMSVISAKMPLVSKSNPGVMQKLQTIMETKEKEMIANPDSPEAKLAVMSKYETSAIACCKTFAMAEDVYRRVDYDNDGILEYSQSLKGLYGEGKINLVDKAFAEAEGKAGKAKRGYLFKVITKQGPGAPGGARDYVRGENMTIGYALVAWPEKWDATGRNCFMISSAGTVYQRDFGAATAETMDKFDAFDPKDWIAAE